MALSNEDVQEIVRLLDELDATELHLRTRHFALWLRRDAASGDWAQANATVTTPHLLGPAAEPAPAPSPPDEPAEPDDGLVAVRAALMGTFYRAPKPGADPFVEVGSAVDEETVVGIVETMKLMNSVYAGTRGRVAQICLDNAEAAEPGTVLLRIAPEER